MKRIMFSSVLAGVLIVTSLFIYCSRDNPFDPDGVNYIEGKKPHVNFADSLISGYLLDTVQIKIAWKDTAVGGAVGSIRSLHIDWNGNGQFADTVAFVQTNPVIISKVFNPQSNWIQIIAVDNDGNTSDIDSAWLNIKRSSPVINSVNLPETIQKNIPFTIKLNSSDTGGIITSYHWAVDENTFSRTTDSGFITLTIEKVGEITVLVKARDNKKIESATKAISIKIVDPSDSVGPDITFLSPMEGDTVYSSQCVVSLQVTDASGISGVTLNNEIAMQKVGLTWRGTVPLDTGVNLITATAIDIKGFISERSIRVVRVMAGFDLNPPVVSLLSPARWKDTTYIGSLVVKFLVDDESGVASVLFENEEIKSDSLDSSYTVVRDLDEGSNSFVISSFDKKGNARIDTLSVYWDNESIDTLAPVIVITQPGYFQHIADSIVTVEGTVTDPSEVTSLKVNGVDAVLNYPVWKATCKVKKGYDTISVIAIDGSVKKNMSEKSVIVIRNQIPVFSNVPKDTFVNISESANFSATVFDDDSSLEFVIAKTNIKYGTTSPLQSSLSTTSFTYTASKTGTDTVNLFVTDPWGDKDTATWRIIVVESSDSLPRFTTQNLPTTILALDTCKASVKAQDPHGLPLVYSFLGSVPAGATIDSFSGAIRWIPAIKDTGAKVIVIQASNGRQKNKLTWNVTVLPQNLQPKISALQNQTINENQKLQMTINAVDPNNDQLEFSFGSSFPKGAVLDSNRFSWTPSFSDAGTHKVVFVVNELNQSPALSDSQTITITVNNVNQKPVLTNPGTINGVAKQLISYTLSAKDPDNDPITYYMANAPEGAVLTDAHVFNWTPSNAGTYSVKFIAKDSQLSDTITVSIKVSSGNEKPTLTNPGDKTTNENDQLRIPLVASDPNGDSLIYSMTNGPSGSRLNGKVFIWRPGYDQAGKYTVTFTVTDHVLPPLSDSKTITITVNNVNASPELKKPGNKTVDENKNLSFALEATDIDNDKLTYSMDNAPRGATLSDKNFSWTPANNQSGNYLVTFFVKDNGSPNLVDSQSINITVRNVNAAPIFTDSTSKTVNENSSLSFKLEAYDPDLTTLIYSSNNLPPGARLSESGMFDWKPGFDQAKSYRVMFIATDNTDKNAILRDTATITLNVNNVNRPPVFTDSTEQTGTENQNITFALKANDPDGNPLSFEAVNLPGNANLSKNGDFSWKPKLNEAGTYNVKFIVKDNSETNAILSDTATIKITIGNANPGGLKLVSPSNNSVGQPKSIKFIWEKAKNANGYDFQLASNSDFTPPIFKEVSTTSDTFTTVGGLSNGTSYWWRVRSRNDGVQGVWTNGWKLTVINTFSLTINKNPSNVGTVTVSSVTPPNADGKYDAGTEVTLTASANQGGGYTFDKWSGDATVNTSSVKVTMNSNITVTAEFVLKTYTLQLVSGSGGTITNPASPSVLVNHGALTDIVASASTGYDFDKWTVVSGSAVFVDSTKSTTKVTLTGAATIRANFKVKSYTLTLSSKTGGTITAPVQVGENSSRDTTLSHNASVSITANAKTGYRFLNWTITGSGTIPLPGSATATINNITGNATVQANFVKTFELIVRVNNAAGGSIEKPDESPVTVDSGASTPIEAQLKAGASYRFDNWTEITSGNSNATITNVSDISTSVKLKGNATVQANFVETFKLTINANSSEGSVVADPPSGPYDAGKVVRLTATPKQENGYKFYKWSGDTIGTTNPLYVTMNSNKNVTAEFVLKTYKLNFSVSGTEGSTVPSVETDVTHGVNTNIRAIAVTGFVFKEWTVEGIASGVNFGNKGDSITTVNLTGGDATIKANFDAKPTYTLNVEASPDDGGSITTPEGRKYVNKNSGDEVEVVADTTNPIYKFTGWTVTSPSSSATIISGADALKASVRILGNATVQANFVKKTYTLNVEASPDTGGSITTPEGGKYVNKNSGDEVEVVADTTNPIYKFTGWTVTSPSGSATIISGADALNASVRILGNATVQAKFDLK